MGELKKERELKSFAAWVGMEFDLLAFFLSGLVGLGQPNAPREKREQPNKSNGMSFCSSLSLLLKKRNKSKERERAGGADGLLFGWLWWGALRHGNQPKRKTSAPPQQTIFHSFKQSKTKKEWNELKRNGILLCLLALIEWKSLLVMGQRPSAPLNFIPNFLQVFHFVNSAQSNQCCSAERRQATPINSSIIFLIY